MGSKSKSANWHNGTKWRKLSIPNFKRWLDLSKNPKLSPEFASQVKRNLDLAKGLGASGVPASSGSKSD